MHKIRLALLCSAFAASPAVAQEMGTHDHGADKPAPTETSPAQDQPAEPMPMDHGSQGKGAQEAPFVEGSGTARLPGAEGGMHGLHLSTGDWMVMAHGFLSTQYTDHSGPRGDDKAYVTSMAMLTGQTSGDWGRLQLKSMFSLEPLMDARGYPNLFATGETADGEALVDRQHPHDLFMELAARVDINVGAGNTVFLYGGPVGEPALGPSAFMHRGSAGYNPEPPITHHWFDSTHITYGVLTAGYSSPLFQLETSAFRGAEPDERRWDIETPRLDSWSVRGTLTPSPNWAIQASYGDITEPEALHPGEDERRFTASAHYSGDDGLSAMLAFSSKKRVGHEDDDHHGEKPALTAWLAEASWKLDPANVLFGRFENVATDELFPDDADPLHDTRFRISKFQAGYARLIPLGPFELALGGSVSLYDKPEELDVAYGDNPWGFTVFARVSLGQ